MKKKGFTLIELLAVIIILAIVALIATPIVLDVIKDAKKSAGLSEAKMIYSGINDYCAQSAMKEQLDGTPDMCKDGVTIGDVSQMIELGKAKIKEVSYGSGKITTLQVESNGYIYTLQNDGSFTTEGSVTPPAVVYNISDVVYYNPETDSKCQVGSGANDYKVINSNTDNKSGCMKWYVYKIEDDNISLLLDHNTTAKIRWSTTSSNDTNGDEVYLQLTADTASWTGKAKESVDLIDAYDIAKITGNTSWTNASDWYYFDTNNTTEPLTYSYGWLYDRTRQTCTTYGCLNNSEVDIYGYWTKTPHGAISNLACNVSYYGLVAGNAVDSDAYFGVRPVIAINRSNL